MTPIVALSRAICSWAGESNAFGNIKPRPGTLFSYVENSGYRGTERIADRLITNRFYFWGRSVPEGLFKPDHNEERARELLGDLRNSMLCYTHSHNATLGDLGPQEIRQLFREDWICPSWEGRAHEGVVPSVLDGLEGFSEAHGGELVPDAFDSFRRAIEDEVGLYKSIVATIDSNSQLDKYRHLLAALIAEGYATLRETGESAGLHICHIGLWDDGSEVEKVIDVLCDAFTADVGYQVQAESFRRTTLDKLKCLERSLELFDNAYVGGDRLAWYQTALMSLCGVPQLYRAACGELAPLGDVDINDEVVAGVLSNACCQDLEVKRVPKVEIAGFKAWVKSCDSRWPWLPEWVRNKADIIWNCVVGAIFGPACTSSGGGVTTLPVSGIEVGHAIGDPIVSGSAPVSIDDFSPRNSQRVLIAKFDMGTPASPRPDGVVLVLGRKRNDPSLDELHEKLVEAAGRAFSGMAGRFESTVRNRVETCTVSARSGRKSTPDPVARDELTDAVVLASNEYFEHAGFSVKAKGLKDALDAAVDAFFTDNQERPYAKALLDEELVHPGSMPGFSSRAHLEGLDASSIAQASLTGKSKVTDAVKRAVGEWIAVAKYTLHEEICNAAGEFCAGRGVSTTLGECIKGELASVVPIELDGVPRKLDLQDYLDGVTRAVQAVNDQREGTFAELGVGEEPDTTVSREHLALRAENARLVAQNLSATSASYIKRNEDGEDVYYLLGSDLAVQELRQKLREEGILAEGESDQAIIVSDEQTIPLHRSDVLHLGARTELQIR